MVLLVGVGLVLSPKWGAATPLPACDPTAYQRLDDTSATGFPPEFCAFSYLPWRVTLPANPHDTNIDHTNTDKLRQYYLPHSGANLPAGTGGANLMKSTWRKPRNNQEGASQHPLYKAKSTDPQINANCTDSSTAQYGCGTLDYAGPGTCTAPDYACYLHTVPAFRIPAYARQSAWYGADDVFLGVVQPDGTAVDVGGCFANDVDWQNGWVLASWNYNPCYSNLYGVSYGAIGGSTPAHGNHLGNINAGDSMAALVVHYQEYLSGNIRHALHVNGGCFQDGVYPGTFALQCSDNAANPPGAGIPTGALMWLDLDHTAVDTMIRDHPEVIPPYMRIFMYAAHDHGVYLLDTGAGVPYIAENFLLEDALPFLTSTHYYENNPGDTLGHGTFWWQFLDSFGQYAGAYADGSYKAINQLDWSSSLMVPHLWILKECYARGTCDDSQPEPGGGPPLVSGPYYIAPNGLNTNDCAAAQSSTTPKHTFQDDGTGPGVLSCLHPSEKVIVQNGTYTQWIEDKIPSGVSGAPTVVQAQSKGGAILRPTTVPPTGAMVRLGADTTGGKSFITVDGLTLDGSGLPTGTRMRGVVIGASGVTQPNTGSHDLLLTNLDIHHIPNNQGTCTAGQESAGVLSTGTSYRLQLTASHIHDIGYDATTTTGVCSVGIAHSGGSSTMTGLEVNACQGAAMCPVDTTSAPTGSNVVQQSFFHDTGGPLALACGTQNNQFSNNILHKIGRYGVAPQIGTVVLGGTCAGLTSSTNLVYNNTIVNSSGSCVQLGVPSGTTAGPSNNNTLQNNLCWQNDSDQVTVVSSSSGNTINHNLVTGSTVPLYGDPLFVTSPWPAAPTAPDFQLRVGPPTSPGIDTGVTLSSVTTDYGGNGRPRGSGYDVGAWEAAGPGPPASNPVAWWRFDEGSGTTAADSTGHGHDLTLSTGVAWGPGKIGGALHCQGNTGRGTTPVLTNLGSYTWMAWMQSPSTPGTAAISAPFVNGSQDGDEFGFSWDHTGGGSVQAGFHRESGGAYDSIQIPGPRLTPNLWYHVAVTFETPANTLRLYLNGQASTVVSNLWTLRAPAGQFFVCGNDAGAQPWTGLLDELKVWSRTLTAGEIQSEYGLAGGAKHVRSHHVVAQ